MTTNQVRFAVAASFFLGGVVVAKLPQPVRVIDSPGVTHCVDVSHDGKLVAAGGRNGKVFVWDAETGKRLLELEEPKRSVASVRFTNGGKTLVTASPNTVRPAMDRFFDGRLTWWDLRTRKPIKRIDFPFAITKLVLSPDGKVLATSSGKYGDEAICLYDAATGKLIRRVPNKIDRRSFAFSPDSKLLAIGGIKEGGGGRVEVLRLADEKQVTLFEPEFVPNSLAISDNGKMIACGGGGEVTLHRMKDGAEIARANLFGEHIKRVAYARGGKWLLGWMGGDTIMVFDGVTLKKQRTEAIYYNRRGGFALSRNGKTLATVGEDDDEVKLWRVDLWE